MRLRSVQVCSGAAHYTLQVDNEIAPPYLVRYFVEELDLNAAYKGVIHCPSTPTSPCKNDDETSN